MWRAVASPVVVGLVARTTSRTSPSWGKVTKEAKHGLALDAQMKALQTLATAFAAGTDEIKADITEKLDTAFPWKPARAFGAVRRMLRQSFETGLSDQLAAEKDSIVAASASS